MINIININFNKIYICFEFIIIIYYYYLLLLLFIIIIIILERGKWISGPISKPISIGAIAEAISDMIDLAKFLGVGGVV